MSSEEENDFASDVLPQMLEKFTSAELASAAIASSYRDEVPLWAFAAFVARGYDRCSGVTKPKQRERFEMADDELELVDGQIASARLLAAEFEPGTLAVALIESAKLAGMSPSKLVAAFMETISLAAADD
jgi:hypothetical protein